jgi:BirA family biotin operon repressor/biotin-[acetyl-CoA-carboxylase] ligase
MRLLSLPVVDSTNNYAQELIDNGLAAEKTVIIALEQTAGKGQYGNNWDSQSGMGLYMSVVLEPKNIATEDQIIFNKAISCGVASYIQDRSNKEVRIKWPNDIVIDNNKIGGLLIENNLRGNHISSVVVGVGINLNQSTFTGLYNFPPISLFQITNKNFDPAIEAEYLYDKIWLAYLRFMNGDKEVIDGDYKNLLYRRMITSHFKKGSEIFDAVLIDVDHTGAALLSKDGMVIRAIHPETKFHLTA